MEKKVRDFARKVTFFHNLWKRSNEIVFKIWVEFETPTFTCPMRFCSRK